MSSDFTGMAAAIRAINDDNCEIEYDNTEPYIPNGISSSNVLAYNESDTFNNTPGSVRNNEQGTQNQNNHDLDSIVNDLLLTTPPTPVNNRQPHSGKIFIHNIVLSSTEENELKNILCENIHFQSLLPLFTGKLNLYIKL